MTKKDIIRKLYEKTNLSLPQSSQAVEGIIEVLAEALADDQAVLLRGFGTFKTVQRAARQVRNLNTGQAMTMPPRKQVKFIAYDTIRQRINRPSNGHSEL